MKLTIPHLRTGAAVLLAGLLLAGCDQQSSDAKHIKVGVINGAEQDVAEVAKKWRKRSMGLMLNWSVSAARCCRTMPPITVNWMPTFSSIVRSLSRIIRHTTISWSRWGIPLSSRWPVIRKNQNGGSTERRRDGGDPERSYQPRACAVAVAKEQLITLKEGKGLLPTALDITANPRHLQIMELEGAQLPRVLDDPKVDVAIISTTYIQQTGLSPVHDSVFIEDKNSPYVNILVAREDNKDAENVKEFLASYQSPEVAKAAETIFNGGAVPGW